jgi:hypothetical protein
MVSFKHRPNFDTLVRDLASKKLIPYKPTSPIIYRRIVCQSFPLLRRKIWNCAGRIIHDLGLVRQAAKVADQGFGWIKAADKNVDRFDIAVAETVVVEECNTF